LGTTKRSAVDAKGRHFTLRAPSPMVCAHWINFVNLEKIARLWECVVRRGRLSENSYRIYTEQVCGIARDRLNLPE
jgi:hypothetical protein